MKPWIKLEESRVAGGAVLSLWQRGDELSIRANSQPLMGSRCQGSELELAKLALDALPSRQGVRVLVAGLGFGYTLRATLDQLDASSSVVVAELASAVVRWNQGPLKELAGKPLEDPRVTVEVADVVQLLRRPEARFDVVLLDVDNGPRACTRDENSWLYTQPGLLRIARVLRPGGVLGVWSAGDDAAFTSQLQASGYGAKAHRVPARPGSKARHMIWIAHSLRKAKGKSASKQAEAASQTKTKRAVAPSEGASGPPRVRTTLAPDADVAWQDRRVRRR